MHLFDLGPIETTPRAAAALPAVAKGRCEVPYFPIAFEGVKNVARSSPRSLSNARSTCGVSDTAARRGLLDRATPGRAVRRADLPFWGIVALRLLLETKQV